MHACSDPHLDIYFRVQGGPTVEQRMNSHHNYCHLFNYILSSETPVNLELPNQWLWEIIDELIYQFQVGLKNGGKRQTDGQKEIERDR